MMGNYYLSKGWCFALLGDLLEYEQPTQYIVKNTDYNNNYKIPVLTAGKSFLLGYTDEKDGVYNNLPVIIFDDFTTAIKFVDFPFKVKSSAMKILKPAHILVNIKYVYFFMETMRLNIDTHKRYWISVGAIQSIPLPPLAEQHRIVNKIEELFTELDKGIETLKTAQQQLKVYRQAVLKYAFEGKLTNPDVKDGELPEGWMERNLASVCDITSSKRIFKDEYVSNGIPFYRTKEVKELSEGKKPAIELYIEKSKYDEIKSRFQVPGKGDVLLSAVGTIGVSYVIRDEKPFYFKDGNLMWFRNLINLDSYFLSYALTHFIRNGKDASVSGSAYNALTIETMKVFKVAIPEFKEQKLVVQEIESRLSVCDKIEESIEQGLQQAEALRQSILKKAFEGKLVPQDPADEPASVLLERIKAERAASQPVKKTKTKKVKA
jgi:type I restriction enzyme S subunit